jgi:hypothetical protein
MNKIIVGLILLGLGVWAGASWWWFLWDVIKGMAVVGMFGVGLVLIGLGAMNLNRPVTAKAKAQQDNE